MLIQKSTGTQVVFAYFIALFAFLSASIQAKIEYLTATPLAKQIAVSGGHVRSSGNIPLHVITWGGDIATIYTQKEGIFSQVGLRFELKAENNFRKQVEACISGETPYIRGTMGMITAAAEALQQKGLELVPIFQLTWSTGGDAMVVRSNIKKPLDLMGKTIALQLYGPHMDYVANILTNANVPPSSPQFKWLIELTFPTYETSAIVDPVSAFQSDSSIDAVMCIIPDALMLTSGGNVGTGSEGSVQGARILLSTKTASRVICDVYAVRKDYLDSHHSEVQKFVQALMKGQEHLQDLLKNKASQQAKFSQLMSTSADLLLGAPQATEDVKALLGDCEFVGYDGNVQYFTSQGTTRTLQTLSEEIQKSFQSMGLITSALTISSANWDYASLARGLRYATLVPSAAGRLDVAQAATKPKFDQAKVAKKVAETISAELEYWEEEGTLFTIEIYFKPNQSQFTVSQYQTDYAEALRIADSYGGALIVIEGHADLPLIIKLRKEGAAQDIIDEKTQAAKNLSLQRANAVRNSFFKYCQSQNILVDESRFAAVGFGYDMPKYNPPRTRAEWQENHRVVFRIKQIEAELNDFIPLE